jgi:hypothetical protein
VKYLIFFILILSSYADDYEISLEYQNCWASTEPFRDTEWKEVVLKPNQPLIDKMETLGKIYKGKKELYNGEIGYNPYITFSDFNEIRKTSFDLKNKMLIETKNSYSSYRNNIEYYKISYLTQVDSSEAIITYYTNEYEKKNYFSSPKTKKENLSVLLNKEKSYASYNKCMEEIASDKNERYIKTALIFVGLLIGLFIAYKLITKLYKRLKKEATKTVDKYNSYKIRKIAEEESIRSSVKKSFDGSDDKDKQDLQDLINKAVAKGDSETAQALLKILNSKKGNDNE